MTVSEQRRIDRLILRVAENDRLLAYMVLSGFAESQRIAVAEILAAASRKNRFLDATEMLRRACGYDDDIFLRRATRIARELNVRLR